MKFHTDEHVADAIVLGLRRRGFDVTTSAQAGILGSTDEEQLDYCRREDRIMISHDEDMLRLAAAGTAHAGIAYCHQKKYRIGEIILRLLSLSAHVSDEDIRGRIEYL